MDGFTIITKNILGQRDSCRPLCGPHKVAVDSKYITLVYAINSGIYLFYFRMRSFLNIYYLKLELCREDEHDPARITQIRETFQNYLGRV